jgi:hypothetical protein
MQFTRRAVRWIETVADKQLMSAPALRTVRIQAGNVARRVGSTRIGQNHLEQALDELVREDTNVQ